VEQQIRFCRSFDGTRIAFATMGKGPPLVRAPHWLTHLEYELRSPLFQHWIEALATGRSLLRFDPRGFGLSDWEVADMTMEAWVRDLEAVVDAAGFERFALLGPSQGASIAIEYAVRHPERVSHLVLAGGYARGSMKRGLPPERIAELKALLKLVESGWGREDSAYREMFAMQFAPGASMEQVSSMSELQRHAASAANALRVMEQFFEIDVQEQAARVTAPTLVLHARGDRRAPFEEGRLLAGLIPGARLVPLESSNHMLLGHEPAFRQFFEELGKFVPTGRGAGKPLQGLTAREAEVLERIAQGLDNAQIAAHLGMSEKTVRNHITHIFDKLGVENRARAIVVAREAGLGQ